MKTQFQPGKWGWGLLGASMAAVLTGCSGGMRPSATSAGDPAPAAEAPRETGVAAQSRKGIEEAAAKPVPPFPGEGWKSLFDGISLEGWKPIGFAGAGEVQCDSSLLILNMGDPFTGVAWTNDFPRINYEIALDAMRWMGSDFFCGLTVPVRTNYCTLVAGGWGGSLLGISSLDGLDASENQSTKFVNFEKGKWYRIRLRVTETKLEAWVDEEKLIDVLLEDRRVGLRPGEIERSIPLGITSWQTMSLVREIKWRPVEEPADPVKIRR